MRVKALLEHLGQTPVLPPVAGRIAAIDLARGVAIALMIVSHTVSGLILFQEVPAWGLVPIHLLTKFSSSLFILVFGVALAMAFLPKTEGPDWPKRRKRLMLRGLQVFVFYKALTVVEMMPVFPPGDILDALLYRRFPIWVEILGFYAIALMWIPWVLPYWRRLPLWSRLLAPPLVALLSTWLEQSSGFLGSQTLKALLVEDSSLYTWGQLTRLPLVMIGLLIGEMLMRGHAAKREALSAGVLLGTGSVLLLSFLAISIPAGLGVALTAVARNVGKHPPELPFMLFSVGGALVILSLCLLGGSLAARRLSPIATLGSEPLVAFAFHIVAIFLVFRFLLGEQIAYTYPLVLSIGVALVPATAMWIALTRWVKRHHAS